MSRRQAAQVGVTEGLDKRAKCDKNSSSYLYPTDRPRAAQDTYLQSVGREWVNPANPAEGTRPVIRGRGPS